MKIAFDARCIYRGMGGIGRYASSLLAALAGIDDRNEYVCTFTPLDLPEDLRLPARCRKRVVEAGMIDERFDHLDLPGLLEEERADLYFNPTFAVPMIRRPGLRTVATVHDVVFRRHPELVPDRLRGYLDRATDRSCRNSHLVLTGSEFSKKEILDLFPAPARDIVVIPHGVHEAKPFPASSSFLERRGLSAGRYVLYVGSVEQKKNIALLLEAFATALADLREESLRLVLAGSHDSASFPLDPTIRKYGLQEWVALLGHVPEAELEALYAGALVFVYPSLYEGFGLPPLEAMIRGVPTIVADTSSLGEVVADGALKVPPCPAGELAAAIADLVRNPARREDLARKGRARAASFCWRRSARHHLDAFKAAVEGP